MLITIDLDNVSYKINTNRKCRPAPTSLCLQKAYYNTPKSPPTHATLANASYAI